jgi:hypothetical protein
MNDPRYLLIGLRLGLGLLLLAAALAGAITHLVIKTDFVPMLTAAACFAGAMYFLATAITLPLWLPLLAARGNQDATVFEDQPALHDYPEYCDTGITARAPQ